MPASPSSHLLQQPGPLIAGHEPPRMIRMPDFTDLSAGILASWRTNSRVTAYLIERLPAALWRASIPGEPNRTIRMLAAHLHNARSRWVRTLGREHGLTPPDLVDRYRVTRRALTAALKRSSRGIESLLELGIAAGGQVPPSRGYVWRNLPLDVEHVLTYFVAHEAHHRGQILLIARQLGQRLPAEVVGGLWAWNRRSVEAAGRAGRPVRGAAARIR